MADTEAVELLPCPFCGGKATAWKPEAPDEKIKYVFCANGVTCGAELTLHEEGQDAIAAWNTRTPPIDVEAVALAIERADREKVPDSYADHIVHPEISDWGVYLAEAAIAAMRACKEG